MGAGKTCARKRVDYQMRARKGYTTRIGRADTTVIAQRMVMGVDLLLFTRASAVLGVHCQVWEKEVPND